MKSLVTTLLFLLFVSSVGTAQIRDRSKVPARYTWNLADVYPSDEAWRAAKQKLEKDIPVIEQYRGTLSSSAKQLLGCLDMLAALNKEFSRVYVYTSLKSDLDTRDSKNLAMRQEMDQVVALFGAKVAFVEPEILAIDSAKVMSFIQQEKGLTVHRQYLHDILRRKAHTGTAGEEKIIADASLVTDAPSTIFGVFSDADFPYDEVTLSDGQTIKLDKPAFSLHRASSNRQDRKKVFATFFGKLNEFRRTFGTQLNAQVKRDMFYRNARKYESCVQAALDANNIPVAVYKSLIDNVNKNLPVFHRYLSLRKQMMKLDTLHYYDLYAPLVSGVELRYTAEEAEKNILSAFAPLGKEYVETVRKGFDQRWIDLYPTEGKRAGAYSQGSIYDVHPFMLLNYNGKYDDMSTLAHELGHTMQSYLSNKNQPYPTAGYPIFVAEVASTFNEALLIDYMLKKIRDDKTRLSLLGSYLENIKATVFRQAQFAEFELRIHELAEAGESLTGDKLNEVYLEITRKYYGHDKGICDVGDEIKSEWMNVPHFYYNFYVFQYATSFTASAALSEKVMSGDKEATKRYLSFLSAGGSEYPIDLLKKAGVDMTTSEPLDLTMQKMSRVMDEIDRIQISSTP